MIFRKKYPIFSFFLNFVATFVWPPTPSCHSLRQRMSWMLPTDLRESSPLPRPFSTLNILKTMTRRCPTQRGWWMLTRRSSVQTAAKEDRCWSPTAREELISREVLWFLWRICKLSSTIHDGKMTKITFHVRSCTGNFGKSKSDEFSTLCQPNLEHLKKSAHVCGPACPRAPKLVCKWLLRIRTGRTDVGRCFCFLLITYWLLELCCRGLWALIISCRASETRINLTPAITTSLPHQLLQSNLLQLHP